MRSAQHGARVSNLNVVGLMVMKNEADRYLEDCLNHQKTFCDRIVVFDDRSTDQSVDIAKNAGCDVFVREEACPTFMDHEGQFRQAAWNCLAGIVNPGDWVFSFDADEFLIGQGFTSRRAVERLVGEAEYLNYTGLTLPVAEVFGLQANGNPMIRTDGFWSDISGLRLVKYVKNGRILDRVMGCGSTPPVDNNLKKKDVATILHYGYANPEDKYIKYERYSSKIDHGHNVAHIQSILREPSLTPWRGTVPSLAGWRQ